jgi:DNA-binding transcriptional ArsR family regulator
MTPMDLVFRALADPTRRSLLDALRHQQGQSLVGLAGQLQMTRQAVAKHLGILEEAGLVVTVQRGREKLHYLNPVPLHEISRRWISSFDHAPLIALSDLKQRLEKENLDGSARETKLGLRDLHRDQPREDLDRPDRP